jgi:hypothetical protein
MEPVMMAGDHSKHLAVCIDGARDDGWGSPETFDVENLE